MINQDYIDDFKNSFSYKTILGGILRGDIEDVLFGNNEYIITTKNDPGRTIPSEVLTTLYIMYKEGKVSYDFIKNLFVEIEVNRDNVCVVLKYMEIHFNRFAKMTNLTINFDSQINHIKSNKSEYLDMQCYKHLTPKIEELY